MKVFLDKNRAEWTLDFTLGTVMEIESYDFSEALGETEETRLRLIPVTETMFDELLTNKKVCAQIAWIVVKDSDDAKERGIDSLEKFAGLLDSTALEDVQATVLDEFSVFFPEMETSLKALRDRLRRTHELLDKKVSAEIHKRLSDDAISNVVDQHLQELDKRLG